MSDIKLSILVCGITNRDFSPLLTHLEKQSHDKPVEILSLVDNRKMKIGRKRNLLVEMSKGEYISFIDDDDWVTDDYVDSILEKVPNGADIITFDLMRYEDGAQDRVCHYTLNIERDYDTPEAYYRLPNHLMAYRKDVAEKVRYEESSFREDSNWSSAIRPYLATTSEVNKVLYNYQYSNDTSESKKNYLFTVVIPTMWSSDKIYESVKNLQDSYGIGEIIVINNNPSGCKKPLEGSKVKVIDFQENIFVNPAWNLGVSKASYDKICLLNDDVILEDMAFHFMTLQLERSDVGVVGLSKSCYNLEDAHVDYRNRPFYLEKISTRNRGWGCAIFFKKENYINIPPDLKIWFGDDWMIKMHENRTFRVHGPKVFADVSQTVDSPSVQHVINQDVQNSIKYNLPWSNDFDL
jgi:glycosyltransferase involved in cell wall biosynthesis